MTKGPIDFVLAGCHAGHPLDDLPALPGPWRWFADRWTGILPHADALSERLGAPVADWPLAFEEQLQTAQAAPSVLLVRGDPLVATPHRHLVDALKELGKRVMIRRRLGVAELAAVISSKMKQDANQFSYAELKKFHCGVSALILQRLFQ